MKKYRGGVDRRLGKRDSRENKTERRHTDTTHASASTGKTDMVAVDILVNAGCFEKDEHACIDEITAQAKSATKNEIKGALDNMLNRLSDSVSASNSIRARAAEKV